MSIELQLKANLPSFAEDTVAIFLHSLFLKENNAGNAKCCNTKHSKEASN